MRAWGASDRGIIRQDNQDAYAVYIAPGGELCVAVVCDGMGGAAAGNVASSLAAELFTTELRSLMRDPAGEEKVREHMQAAVNCANYAVYEKSRIDETCRGMGTTLVGALAISGEEEAYVVNVGDSRAYRASEKGIKKITRDHSVVEDMIDKGEITPLEAQSHPSKNLITRAVGTEKHVTADAYRVKLSPGEYLLLCSDGVTNQVNEQELLYEILHGGEPEDCCGRILEIVKSRGARDNITAVLIEG